MDRKEDLRLTELKESGKPIYSISRLDTINRCLYEAYKTYILGERGRENIYTHLGSATHDILEGITNGKNTESDLLPALKSELDNLDIIGLEFPKDRQGRDIIKQHWIQDMTHFCETYKAPKGKNLKAEELFIYKTPAGHYLQGYIDLQNIRKDGSLDIYDYKTSSLYQGDALKEHSRQLIVYALGKEQEGFKVNSASFIFLKYAKIEYIGKQNSKSKKETLISKCIERYKIGSELTDNIEQELLKQGYDEIDVEILLDHFKSKNTFDILPDTINQKYKMSPYVLKADLSDEAKQETINYIDSTIEMWEKLDKKENSYPPLSFEKISKTGRVSENTFFCVTLCPHYHHCQYIQDYLAKRVGGKNNDDEDLF